MLLAAELQCAGENMRCIADMNNGLLFNVPNFCITDPIFEKDFTVYQKRESQIKDKDLTVCLFNLRYLYYII
jgi:hypothetical protein